MPEIKWDQIGERLYETGVDHGVLYIPDSAGLYANGYAWNGLVNVTEAPSGAESNKQYADNIPYLNLKSREEFNATIEAFTCPREFYQCDGSAIVNGVTVGQQNRKSFGFSYRTLVGNDLVGTDHGYKIHLVYGCDAGVSERANATVNDSPEAMTLSWEVNTTPVEVGLVGGVMYKPTSHLTISSLDVPAAALTNLEDILYGRSGNARLPLPAEVLAMFAGAVTVATPVAPTYTAATKTIVIPATTGVDYRIDGKIVTGSVVITKDTIVTATPRLGYKFPLATDDDWGFKFA